MDRRKFIRTNSIIATAAAGVGVFSAEAAYNKDQAFKCDYAPHLGMFKNNAGEDPMSQIDFMADHGFRSMEDNHMKERSIELQTKIAKRMEKNGMRMGVFTASTVFWKEPNLTSGDLEKRANFLSEIRDSVEVAKRVNAKWINVVPGFVQLGMGEGYQTVNVVESLKQATAILEPHGIIMVLEPLNWERDHAGQFLRYSHQAYQVCKQVDSPSCKIQFDIYHQQITEGDLIRNIAKCWDEIAYFQIGDHPGRNEPGTGEINYFNVLKSIYEKGYRDILGMEHHNINPGKEGEMAVIEAYRKVDSF